LKILDIFDKNVYFFEKFQKLKDKACICPEVRSD